MCLISIAIGSDESEQLNLVDWLVEVIFWVFLFAILDNFDAIIFVIL